MNSRRNSGKLYYTDGGSDHLDVSTFIFRGNEIAFSLASVSQKHGRWEAESGQAALMQPDGTFLAKQILAHKLDVPSVPWDIVFNVVHEEPKKFIEVSGKIIEEGVPGEFSGELNAMG